MADRGIVCRTERVGPDIQIPSLGIDINVELGGSDIYGNIAKALQAFSKVIVCSDEKSIVEGISDGIKDQNVLCAVVQDVPALVGLMRFDAGTSNR